MTRVMMYLVAILEFPVGFFVSRRTWVLMEVNGSALVYTNDVFLRVYVNPHGTMRAFLIISVHFLLLRSS
jgi:hypothetical protein